MKACVFLGIALLVASALPAGDARDIFGGITTKETKLDRWCRGTIKSVGDNELVSTEGGFEPGALKGRVINPNFERSLAPPDAETAKQYGDAPQYCVKYYRIIGNTTDTIATDPADGKLTAYAKAGDRYLLCGFFKVQKVGDRFVMFTPLGHPYMGFGPDSTYPGLYGYLPGARSKVPPEQDGWQIKYGGSRARWYTHFMEQMGKVGFNMSAGYFSDVPLFSPSASGDVFIKPELPFIAWYHALEVAMYPKAGVMRDGRLTKVGLFDSPIKDILDGCQFGRDHIHGRNQGDIFDPQFEKACEIMSQRQAPRIWTNPWFIGYILEETDFLFAFARDRSQFHLGWGVMASLPHQGQSSRGEFGQPAFTDTKNYTKYALRGFLERKYATIQKLNEAWGSDYTAWDTTPEGYGKGKGFLDEDGKLGAAWLGARHTMVSRNPKEKPNPNCLKDLTDFIPVYVDRLHKVESQYLRKADPNHLIIGCKVPADLDEYKAMATYVDMLRGLPPKGAEGEFVKPGLLAVYLSADEDSAMHVFYDGDKKPYRDPKGYAKTQPEKAALYREKLLDGWNYTPDGKTYPMVLVSYWAWAENSSEKRNWGVVSLKDNLYDGKEATKLGADGKPGTWDDEDRDFGDCVTGFKAAHDAMLNMLKDFISKGRTAAPRTDASGKEGLWNWVPEDQY
ncbi:MAG: hypothetical protein NTW87_19670 [Planctomycetota bacterium]|nr:hypothetical protein [Planctomycetota bacterium]